MKIARVVCIAMALLAAQAASLDRAAAQDGGTTISKSKTTIHLGTATPGGGFPFYGTAFAAVMN